MKRIKNIIEWLTFKDIKKDSLYEQLKIDTYNPIGSPINLEKGIKMLIENIIDLNYSTIKYSRALILLTMLIIVLTLIMAFK